MTPELRHALDDAYAVFARYDAPDYLGLSGNLQLRDFSVESWHQLTAKHDMGVLMYSDNGELLRYFLPRWLEWLSDEAVRDLGSYEWQWQGLSYRLAHAKWQSWPTHEVAALREVFETTTRAEIGDYNGAPSYSSPRIRRDLGEEGERLGLTGSDVSSGLLEFLCEIGEAPLYLEPWLDTNLPQLARWLWTADLNYHQGAREWIASSRLESELEAAFFADADGPDAELFSRSVELVRALRAL